MSHLLHTTLVAFATLLLSLGVSLGEGEPQVREDSNAGLPQRPTLYLIGDSTVKNRTRDQMGWGTPLADLFDQKRIRVENHALGGRSSRSYLREGLWQKVRESLKPGDFVLIQFGHNDNGPVAEGKARASLKGNGDEAEEVVLTETGQPETVHSFGWYLRKYIAETRAKGATPIVCSLVPRNIWKDGKITRGAAGHGGWAAEAARQEGALFIDLNEIVSRRYEQDGPEVVGSRYFTTVDHTHTTPAGAQLNAECVAEGVKALKECTLAEYLRTSPESLTTSASVSTP